MVERTFRLSDGVELRHLCTEVQSPRAVVVGLHGLGEHGGRYAEMAGVYAAHGVAFHMADMRGHGGSPGARGQASYARWVADALEFFHKAAGEAGVPVVLFGHSLGGNLALHLLLTQRLPIVGAVVTSPWLQLVRPIRGAKFLLMKIGGALCPGVTMDNGLGEGGELYHGARESDAYIGDPLVHGRISLGLASGASRAAAHSIAHADRLGVPLLLLQGRADPVCSARGAREFVRRAGPLCRYYEYPGLYHELQNEAERHDVFARELAFIEEILQE